MSQKYKLSIFIVVLILTINQNRRTFYFYNNKLDEKSLSKLYPIF